MATGAEIRDRAASDLGRLALGQSLAAQDATRITAGYAEVYAALKKEGLATWAYASEVPDELVPYVVALVADNCLNTYGVSPERFARIKAVVQTAMREIRRLTATDYVSQDDPTDF